MFVEGTYAVSPLFPLPLNASTYIPTEENYLLFQMAIGSTMVMIPNRAIYAPKMSTFATNNNFTVGFFIQVFTPLFLFFSNSQDVVNFV
jgi:hypothetical protein